MRRHDPKSLFVLLILTAGALQAAAEPAPTISPEERRQLLERAESLKDQAAGMKAAAEARRKEADSACWKKTLVSSCLDDAHQENLKAGAAARKLELEARRIERELRRRDQAEHAAERAQRAPQREAELAEKTERGREEAAAREKKQAGQQAEQARRAEEGRLRAAQEAKRRQEKAAERDRKIREAEKKAREREEKRQREAAEGAAK